MKTERTASSYPTAAEINALPEKVRLYIHDLETRCDKSGDVQTIAILREDRDALQRRVEELEAEKQKPKRKQNPYCSVRWCQGVTPHEDDELVVLLLDLYRNRPAELAELASEAMRALEHSMRGDIDGKNVVAWYTRSRQGFELFIRTLYTLLLAPETDLPHIFSGVLPNGLGFAFKKANEDIFANSLALYEEAEDPRLNKATFADLLNESAHVSFRALILCRSWTVRDDPRVQSTAKHLGERMRSNSMILSYVTDLFSKGNSRTEILNELQRVRSHNSDDEK